MLVMYLPSPSVSRVFGLPKLKLCPYVPWFYSLFHSLILTALGFLYRNQSQTPVTCPLMSSSFHLVQYLQDSAMLWYVRVRNIVPYTVFVAIHPSMGKGHTVGPFHLLTIIRTFMNNDIQISLWGSFSCFRYVCLLRLLVILGCG